MQANPYRAEAENISARLAVTTTPKQRRELLHKLEHYEREAQRFDSQKGAKRDSDQ